MEKEIRIYALHSCWRSVEDIVKYLKIKDEEIIKRMIWDSVSPDYVIATELIYTHRKYFKEFTKFYRKQEIIFVFFAGECVEPDLNIFDYAVAFNRELHNLDRIGRIPPRYFHAVSVFQDKNDITQAEALEALTEKKFCNFIYSNPKANPIRDQLFYEISKYKMVDSLGAHLNNTGMKTTRNNDDWRELSIEMKGNYKFTIACENASYEGYTSEKLLTTFQAHSIPIYWGNPRVSVEYNEEAFIDCNQYHTLDEVLKRVIEIDENDELWAEIVSKPWQTKEQFEQMEIDMQKYEQFINHIFRQDKKAAQRRSIGTWPDIYSTWFSCKFHMQVFLLRKLVRFIKKVL